MAKLSKTELQPQSRDHLRLQARLRFYWPTLVTMWMHNLSEQNLCKHKTERTSKHKNLLRFCFTPSKLNMSNKSCFEPQRRSLWCWNSRLSKSQKTPCCWWMLRKLQLMSNSMSSFDGQRLNPLTVAHLKEDDSSSAANWRWSTSASFASLLETSIWSSRRRSLASMSRWSWCNKPPSTIWQLQKSLKCAREHRRDKLIWSSSLSGGNNSSCVCWTQQIPRNCKICTSWNVHGTSGKGAGCRSTNPHHLYSNCGAKKAWLVATHSW